MQHPSGVRHFRFNKVGKKRPPLIPGGLCRLGLIKTFLHLGLKNQETANKAKKGVSAVILCKCRRLWRRVRISLRGTFFGLQREYILPQMKFSLVFKCCIRIYTIFKVFLIKCADSKVFLINLA